MRMHGGATLSVHIVLGVAALTIGVGAMASRKGGTWHRRWGRSFVAAMAGASITGGVLSVRMQSPFLLCLTVFTAYLVYSGYRSVHMHRARAWPRVADAIAIAAAAASALLMTSMTAAGSSGIALLFAGLLALLVVRDAYETAFPHVHGRTWWASHMGKMLGSYVAAITAVSVAQLSMLGNWRWVWPSAIGVPAILLAVRWMRPRFARGG